MSGNAPQLREIVERYLAHAGDFGQPVALSAFGLTREQTERVFSSLDEDYHISRFLKFMCRAAEPNETFAINSFQQSHVSIDADIKSIL
jgi:hypothetical protein